MMKTSTCERCWRSMKRSRSTASGSAITVFGIEACVAAVVLGAEVLEKHFTYSTKMPGDDHPGAMTPETLAEMVHRIERVEKMLGSPEKKLLKAEEGLIGALRHKLAEVDFQ